MIKPFIIVWRLAAILCWTLFMLALFSIAGLLKFPRRDFMPQRWHKVTAKILGLKIEREGKISAHVPTLFVANHSSYLDIVVLGAELHASFVAKKEIDGWPIIGFLARCQRTIFIERNPRLAKQHQAEISTALKAKQNLVLFPEGTSTDGNRVLPFKSTLFGVATSEESPEGLMIQPVTVAYTKLDGMPINRVLRPFVTWYGDMELGTHALEFLGLGKVTVRVTYHPVVAKDDFKNRKELSHYCENKVAQGLKESYTGRREKNVTLQVCHPS
jgi:1-acyl-sn-glycerol-3-phosphate acyltransferase